MPAASCRPAHTRTDVCRGRRCFAHSGGFMFVRSAVRLVVAALAILAIGAGHAAAQGQTGSISGVVRDSSGAVLPGVTVEAASPALIEKVRSVVTDGTGAYTIVNLRPGTYSVSFTLPGFN